MLLLPKKLCKLETEALFPLSQVIIKQSQFDEQVYSQLMAITCKRVDDIVMLRFTDIMVYKYVLL